MRILPEINATSVVLVGNLNPRIFRPDWFAKNGLISEQELEEVDIEVIHKEITAFRLDWANFRIEPNRFIIETEEAPFVRIADLTVRTFKEFLTHTPIGMLGINRKVHFPVKDDATRDRIGESLAPKDPWGEWSNDLKRSEANTHGGMRSLTMEQAVVDDRVKGAIRAKIEPSNKVKFGIYMEINDHYEVENFDSVNGCDEIIGLLESRFDLSINKSEWIIDQIMALA
jgi:hypothetical protein